MLSDVCFEVKEKLGAALATYEDVGYPGWQIKAVIDAMALLARVQLVNDYPNFEGDKTYDARLEKGVIENVNSVLVRTKKEFKKQEREWKQKQKGAGK